MVRESRLQQIVENILPFYPVILVVVLTPAFSFSGVSWAGIMLGVVLLVYQETWWTCIFGLLNVIAIFAMMIVSGIPYIKHLM